MLMPSKVLVPRPISSSTIRLRGVALFRMLAVSCISTIKVLRPRARSSLAPTRVNTRSTRPSSALARGHEGAGVGQDGQHRHLADVGGLAGHVGAGDQISWLVGVVQQRVVGHEALAGQGLDHRVSPVADAQYVALDQPGRT
jgi:hypothetical protein